MRWIIFLRNTKLYKDIQILTLVILWSFIAGIGTASPYVNIITQQISPSTTVLYPPIEFTDATAKEWRSIGRYLIATHYQTYILKWSGYGGDIDQGKDFISDIRQAQKQGKEIIFQLVGNSYSMSALTVCYANKINNPDRRFLMFHADAYYNKNKEDIRVPRSRTRIDQELQQCINMHIITQFNVDQMWKGYELYVNGFKTWYRFDPRKPED